MVQISSEILEIIKNFIDEAKLDNIIINQAVLFGSYAKGTSHEFSDIDLAVVSDSFEGNRLIDNMKLSRARIKSSIDLETHPFKNEDFNEFHPFVSEIMSYGIRII